jgi:RimJ/RimL family protein N-acetyltransferase
MTTHPRIPDFELSGYGLLLRPLTIDDVDALNAASAESQETYRWTSAPDGSDAIDYITQALRHKETGFRFPFAVVWQGRIVGSTSYMDIQYWEWPKHCDQPPREWPDAVEVGYTWLAHSVQRTGLNTEQKWVMLNFAFESWKVHRVSLKTDERNMRSRNAIERIGATFDGVLRGETRGNDCTVRNTACYSILATEWPEVKASLDARRRRAD